MELILYMNKSARNVVTKSITRVHRLNGGFNQSTNLLRPEFKVDNNIDPNSFNYMYIPEFHRYYYCDVSTKIGNGSFGCWITGEVDVLMSYKDAILNSQVEVTECSQYNDNVSKDIPVESRSYVETHASDPLEGRHAVLITV